MGGQEAAPRRHHLGCSAGAGPGCDSEKEPLQGLLLFLPDPSRMAVKKHSATALLPLPPHLAFCSSYTPSPDMIKVESFLDSGAARLGLTSIKRRKVHRSLMGLPLTPGYKKKRSRPSKLCVLRRDITESINLSRLADVESMVVNLQETPG